MLNVISNISDTSKCWMAYEISENKINELLKSMIRIIWSVPNPFETRNKIEKQRRTKVESKWRSCTLRPFCKKDWNQMITIREYFVLRYQLHYSLTWIWNSIVSQCDFCMTYFCFLWAPSIRLTWPRKNSKNDRWYSQIVMKNVKNTAFTIK